jgi:hypothetical protein
MPVYSTDTLADLDECIIALERAGAPGRAHVVRQFKNGRLTLLDVQRSTSARVFKTFAAQCGTQPALVIIGADDGCYDGPEAWPLTARLFRWAEAVVLHGAGSNVDYYELVCVLAERHRRALLVECASSALPAWKAIARPAYDRHDVNVVLEVLPLGGVHPLPSPPAPAH